MKKYNRWNDVINNWLKMFPHIIITDGEYKSLDDSICDYGDDRWTSGNQAGQESAYE
jgi:hypothetical protein